MGIAARADSIADRPVVGRLQRQQLAVDRRLDVRESISIGLRDICDDDDEIELRHRGECTHGLGRRDERVVADRRDLERERVEAVEIAGDHEDRDLGVTSA